MKTIKKIFCTLSIATMLFSMNLIFFERQARGDAHFMEALSIIRFDEKLKAQNFALKDLNGNDVNLKDYRGEIVFLNFWATWCLPCLVEMPSMEKLYSEFKNKNFTILAVDMQEDAATVQNFKERFKLSFPILLDSEGVVASYYGVMSIPTTYFIVRCTWF